MYTIRFSITVNIGTQPTLYCKLFIARQIRIGS